MALYPAKFGGNCNNCSSSYTTGDMIDRRNVGGSWQTLACPECSGAPKAVDLVVRVAQIKHLANGFAICDVTLVEGEAPSPRFALKGTYQPSIGSVFEARGVFAHDRWGWTFTAASVRARFEASREGIYAFLQRFEGIGPRRASTIIDRFGPSTESIVDALQDVEKLTSISGITAEMAEQIAVQYAAQGPAREALLMLDELRVPASAQAWLLTQFGTALQQSLLDDPYILMLAPGVGFSTADRCASKLKIAPRDPRRLAALVQTLLDAAASEGHTVSSIDDLMAL